ncbi:MAG: 4Fe-4S dicluster domain-containing protein [Rhizobiaceae bacterium]
MIRVAGSDMAEIPLDKLAAALAPHGLILRGGFEFGENDDLSGTLILVGSAGDGWWQPFQDWLCEGGGSTDNPLDSWTREIVGALAADHDARLIMPNDRPYAPFQQWAMRAEGLHASPLGILTHPEYGLWHSYRAALLFDAPMSDAMIQAAQNVVHACDACVGKPCLNACSVGAHSRGGFDHAGCLAHVCGEAGEACRAEGCFSRNACPVGMDWRYRSGVQAFLQTAFAGL